MDSAETFIHYTLRAFLAVPFLASGVGLAILGDSRDLPVLSLLGLPVFLVGFAWLARCVWKGFVYKVFE